MNQGLWLCQIVLMLQQKCRCQYNNYEYQSPYIQNQYPNAGYRPQQLDNIVNIYGPITQLRSANSIDSSCGSNSCNDDYETDTSEECLCNCNKCMDPPDCCLEYCLRCSEHNGIARNLNTLAPDLVVIPYAVPILVFPIKNHNINGSKAGNKTNSSGNATKVSSQEKIHTGQSIGSSPEVRNNATVVTTPASSTQKTTSKQEIETDFQTKHTTFNESKASKSNELPEESEMSEDNEITEDNEASENTNETVKSNGTKYYLVAEHLPESYTKTSLPPLPLQYINTANVTILKYNQNTTDMLRQLVTLRKIIKYVKEVNKRKTKSKKNDNTRESTNAPFFEIKINNFKN